MVILKEYRMENLEFRILSFPKRRVHSKFKIQNSKLQRLLAVIIFSLSISFSFGQKPVPELWGIRVHDDAHALKQETVDQLEKI